MDDLMKTEAKEIITSAVEKASGAGGVNVEVNIPTFILVRQHAKL